MIGWYTDNTVSQTVMKTLANAGIETKHISKFKDTDPQPSIFYGIMRGAGNAMRVLEYLDIDYWYIDNGYFDAEYINEQLVKRMDGKYRFVKNAQHDVFPGRPKAVNKQIESALILPPSQYSAYFHNTTPEDWEAAIKSSLPKYIMTETRKKGEQYPLDGQIARHDAVIAFNSMAVIRATEMGKAAYDTHGCFRNIHLLPQNIVYDINDLHAFYDRRQWTLDEIRREGSIVWG